MALYSYGLYSYGQCSYGLREVDCERRRLHVKPRLVLPQHRAEVVPPEPRREHLYSYGSHSYGLYRYGRPI